MKKTTITEAQAKVLADAIRDYAQAQTEFETWFMHRDGYDYDSFEDAVEGSFRFFAKRDHKNDQEGYIAKCIEEARNDYEKRRQGIVVAHASSHTLRALEKKGLIEVIRDGRQMYDVIRLLYV